AGAKLTCALGGALTEEAGPVTAGNVVYRPNGCIHNVSTQNGATALAVLTGDIEPTNDAAGAVRSQMVTLSELPWIDARPGVRQKRIWEDKSTERRAILARFEPGAKLPLHRHGGDERILLGEGAHADEPG